MHKFSVHMPLEYHSVCIHTHSHVLRYSHTYTHTHTPMFTPPYMHAIHPHSHTVTHLHTYTCSHAHTHVHTHSHMLIRVHKHALSLTHPHTCVLTLTHIHAHTHSAPAPAQLRTDHLALLIYRRTSSWGRKSGCLLVTLSFPPQPQEGDSQGGSPPSSETNSETPAGCQLPWASVSHSAD